MKMLPWTRRCRLTLFLLAHEQQLKNILAVIEADAAKAAAVEGVNPAIVSEVQTIYADLQNPKFDSSVWAGIGDLWALRSTVEKQGFSYATVKAAVGQVELAVSQIEAGLAATSASATTSPTAAAPGANASGSPAVPAAAAAPSTPAPPAASNTQPSGSSPSST
jgi:hypothetical protein